MSDEIRVTHGWVRWGPKVTSPSMNIDCVWIYADSPRFERNSSDFPRDLRFWRDQRVIRLLWVNAKNEVVRTTEFPLSLDSIDAIATKYKILGGKWLVFRPPTQIDDVWAIIADTVVEDRLGISAKVASAKNRGKKDTHVICVYTEDYLDEADIMRVRKVLSELGINETLYYKPDIYTYLRIYSGETSIKASRYTG